MIEDVEIRLPSLPDQHGLKFYPVKPIQKNMDLHLSRHHGSLLILILARDVFPD